MKAYWIALYIKIKNEDNLKKYSEVAIPILKKYGGVPLVRGGKYKSFSGSEFSRTVSKFTFNNHKIINILIKHIES